MKKALHLYYSSWEHESRAWRAGELVLENGLVDEVIYAGHQTSALPDEASRGDSERIVRLPPRLGSPEEARGARIFGMLGWWREVLRRFGSDRDVRFIQAHGLSCLPVAVLLKWKLRVPLLYDAHELETERDGWGERTKKIARIMERSLIRFADHTIVVGDTIRQWYARTYPGLAVSLVRNVPTIAASGSTLPGLRQALGIPPGDLVCVYCGVISPNRGTRELIEVFRKLPPDRHIVFVGYGDDVEMLKRESAGEKNIHYHPAVPPDQVVDFIRDADVGVIFLVSEALSYRYAMPNKLFEYSAAGLAIICNDGDEMKQFVESHRLGWVVPAEVEAFVDILAKLDRPAVKAVAAVSDRNLPTSEQEMARLLTILREMLSARP